MILVSHRLGAVCNADQIFVMDGGGFRELAAAEGWFSHIWKEQVKWYREG